mmetsp:Transcript_80385/g.245716  ORF Transcript_80385/g.245716 Transcript_80385/m.245716 type:complete len:244 (-) Transcript_80385:1184-1915(-)
MLQDAPENAPPRHAHVPVPKASIASVADSLPAFALLSSSHTPRWEQTRDSFAPGHATQTWGLDARAVKYPSAQVSHLAPPKPAKQSQRPEMLHVPPMLQPGSSRVQPDIANVLKFPLEIPTMRSRSPSWSKSRAAGAAKNSCRQPAARFPMSMMSMEPNLLSRCTYAKVSGDCTRPRVALLPALSPPPVRFGWCAACGFRRTPPPQAQHASTAVRPVPVGSSWPFSSYSLLSGRAPHTEHAIC